MYVCMYVCILLADKGRRSRDVKHSMHLAWNDHVHLHD